MSDAPCLRQRLYLGMALASIFLACGKDATGPENTPAIKETDLTGTWRASVQAPGFMVKVIMEIGADHSMSFNQRYTDMIASAPDSIVDHSLESGTWSLNGDMLRSNKAVCKYASAPAFQLKDSTCTAPLSKDYSFNIKGNSMTVVDGLAFYVFTRD